MRSTYTFWTKLALTQLLVFTTFLSFAGGGKSKVLEALKKLPQVSDIVSISGSTESYAFSFEQHCNPFDPSSPVFKQRAYLYHADAKAPVVVELEGYDSDGTYPNELASLIKANRLIIEHRYFGKSMPRDSIPWKTLTIRNAAEDHHLLISAIKSVLYTNNQWISTGISKGGQTTLIHRSYYPEDVHASVCYVAPLNFEREDPRIHAFLESVGTAEERAKVREFQLRCLRRKDELVKELKKKMEEKRWSWAFPPEVALDYYILEYSFAFWQWHSRDFNAMPGETATARQLLDHVLWVSGVSFFEDHGVEELRSYFFAAMTEEGIYDYDTTGFSPFLSQSVYNFEFTLPKGYENAVFDPKPIAEVGDFLQNQASRMLFIYGELDPWSSTGVVLPANAQERELYKFVLQDANHATRILHFGFQEQSEILRILDSWLK